MTAGMILNSFSLPRRASLKKPISCYSGISSFFLRMTSRILEIDKEFSYGPISSRTLIGVDLQTTRRVWIAWLDG